MKNKPAVVAGVSVGGVLLIVLGQVITSFLQQGATEGIKSGAQYLAESAAQEAANKAIEEQKQELIQNALKEQVKKTLDQKIPSEPTLIGKWRELDSDFIMEIREDGTFEYTGHEKLNETTDTALGEVQMKGLIFMVGKGTWARSEQTVKFTYEKPEKIENAQPLEISVPQLETLAKSEDPEVAKQAGEQLKEFQETLQTNFSENLADEIAGRTISEELQEISPIRLKLKSEDGETTTYLRVLN